MDVRPLVEDQPGPAESCWLGRCDDHHLCKCTPSVEPVPWTLSCLCSSELDTQWLPSTAGSSRLHLMSHHILWANTAQIQQEFCVCVHNIIIVYTHTHTHTYSWSPKGSSGVPRRSKVTLLFLFFLFTVCLVYLFCGSMHSSLSPVVPFCNLTLLCPKERLKSINIIKRWHMIWLEIKVIILSEKFCPQSFQVAQHFSLGALTPDRHWQLSLSLSVWLSLHTSSPSTMSWALSGSVLCSACHSLPAMSSKSILSCLTLNSDWLDDALLLGPVNNH